MGWFILSQLFSTLISMVHFCRISDADAVRSLLHRTGYEACVYLAGVTANPDGGWVAQQARQMVWTLEEEGADKRFLIHDNDSKFTAPFDTVFQSEGLRVIHTPFQAPNANSIAERWVRSVREECLDHLLILNQTHLWRVLNRFIDYYNTARPHQGLAQQVPMPRRLTCDGGSIQRRDVLGGIIGDYYRAPNNTALVLA